LCLGKEDRMEAEEGINVKLDVSGEQRRRKPAKVTYQCSAKKTKTRRLVIQLGTISLTIFRIPVLERSLGRI
jgi:hypothetical protein